MKVDNQAEPTFIKITQKESKTHISFGYHSLSVKEGDRYNFYIPALDIYFFADNPEEGKKIGKAMTQSFFDYFFKKQGISAFYKEIHRLGFKTKNHDMVMRSALKLKQIRPAKFKFMTNSIPQYFETAISSNQQCELSIAS